jgi:hypothetical protein
LLVLLWLIDRRTVLELIIVFAVKFVPDLELKTTTTTATRRTTPAASIAAATTATTTTTTGSLLNFSPFVLLVELLFLGSLTLKIIDLLAKLSTTIVLIPLLLFLYLLQCLLEIVSAHGRSNSESGKLLDNGEVKVELVVLLDNLASALALVLLSATELYHVGRLALSL